MSTSGSYSWSPTVGQTINHAFALIGIQASQVDREKIHNAVAHLNLLASAWSNTGPNLWAEDQQSIPLVSGTSTYTVDPATLTILNAWISYGSPSTDRVITSISHDEYTSYPNKATTGFPTVYWYEPRITQSIVLYPVPDSTYRYTLNFLRVRQMQDSVIGGALSPEIPFHWVDATVWGLAERLAFIYAPDKIALVGARAMKAYNDAAKQDTENAPFKIGFDLSGFVPS